VIFITLLTLAGFAGIVWGTVAIAGYWVSKSAYYKKLARSEIIELHKAQRVIRAIANGAGNPQLEAEIYLDTYNSKEIDV
jgi:hypothetical protein